MAFIEPPLSPAEAAGLLRSRMVPHRETVLQVLDQLSALQAVANQGRRDEIGGLYRAVRTRLLVMGAGALLVAFAVAVIASRQVNRLQREIERQRGIEQSNREDLERLSASLVSVQEAERRTVARELHDEVGQALAAVKMDIGIALRTDVDPRVRIALEEARDISEATLRIVRDMSQLLHPSVLDDFGLPATLTTYLRNFSQRTGIRAQLAETLERRLAPEIELCVYRIVQEALSNVAQHSGATSSRYGPVGRFGRRYPPVPSVTASRVRPVAVCVTVTVTPGRRPLSSGRFGRAWPRSTRPCSCCWRPADFH